MFEDTVTSSNGSLLSEINHNRNSLNTSELSVYGDPSISSDGNIIFQARSGTSIAGGKIGARMQLENEFVLKQNTKYLIKMTPMSNNTGINSNLCWYEYSF